MLFFEHNSKNSIGIAISISENLSPITKSILKHKSIGDINIDIKKVSPIFDTSILTTLIMILLCVKANNFVDGFKKNFVVSSDNQEVSNYIS